MSFNQSNKDKLDLLFKKTLGFQFRDSDLQPAQENLVNNYINNNLIYSQSIPTVDETLELSSEKFDTNVTLIYKTIITPSNYSHIKKYYNLTLTNVVNTIEPGTGGSWLPNTDEQKKLLTKFIFNLGSNANLGCLIEINNQSPIKLDDTAYSPIINGGVLIFLGNPGDEIKSNSTIIIKEFFIYDGEFGLNNLNNNKILAIDASFTNLDVSGNTNLQKLLAFDGSFNNLDISNTFILNNALFVFKVSDTSYITLKAPDTIDNSYTLTLPTTSGNSGEYLSVDGSGRLRFDDIITTNGLAIEASLNNFSYSPSFENVTISGDLLFKVSNTSYVTINSNIDEDGYTSFISNAHYFEFSTQADNKYNGIVFNYTDINQSEKYSVIEYDSSINLFSFYYNNYNEYANLKAKKLQIEELDINYDDGSYINVRYINESDVIEFTDSGKLSNFNLKKLFANTISANTISADMITANTISADTISAYTISADTISVDTISANTGNFNDLNIKYGDISNITIQYDNDALIFMDSGQLFNLRANTGIFNDLNIKYGDNSNITIQYSTTNDTLLFMNNEQLIDLIVDKLTATTGEFNRLNIRYGDISNITIQYNNDALIFMDSGQLFNLRANKLNANDASFNNDVDIYGTLTINNNLINLGGTSTSVDNQELGITFNYISSNAIDVSKNAFFGLITSSNKFVLLNDVSINRFNNIALDDSSYGDLILNEIIAKYYNDISANDISGNNISANNLNISHIINTQQINTTGPITIHNPITYDIPNEKLSIFAPARIYAKLYSSINNTKFISNTNNNNNNNPFSGSRLLINDTGDILVTFTDINKLGIYAYDQSSDNWNLKFIMNVYMNRVTDAEPNDISENRLTNWFGMNRLGTKVVYREYGTPDELDTWKGSTHPIRILYLDDQEWKTQNISSFAGSYDSSKNMNLFPPWGITMSKDGKTIACQIKNNLEFSGNFTSQYDTFFNTYKIGIIKDTSVPGTAPFSTDTSYVIDMSSLLIPPYQPWDSDNFAIGNYGPIILNSDGTRIAFGTVPSGGGKTYETEQETDIYVLFFDGDQWQFLDKIGDPNPELTEDGSIFVFGNSLAFDDSGNTLAIGSTYNNTVYIYNFTDTPQSNGSYNLDISFTGKDNDISFGSSLALSGDGKRVFIGAAEYWNSTGYGNNAENIETYNPNSGKIFIYEKTENGWIPICDPNGIRSSVGQADGTFCLGFGYYMGINSAGTKIASGSWNQNPISIFDIINQDAWSVNISDNTTLQTLLAVDASFTNLDVSANTKLQTLLAVDASFTNLDVSGNTKLQTLLAVDASFDNVDIDKRLLIQGYDFDFSYIATNYLNSFNYIANIPLQDPSSNNIFTDNNSNNIFNTNIAYSPTLKIYVISRQYNLIYSYNGIDWYICKNDSNGFMEFSYINKGFIEWFGDDLNKFFMTTNPSNANDDRNKFMYYSENGIIWKSIFINSWNSEQAKPNKIIYSSTLQKLFAIGQTTRNATIWECPTNQAAFTKITDNFYPTYHPYDGGLHMIWNSILQKFFVVVKHKLGNIPIIYYNSNNDLNQNWIRAPNVYDYTNKLFTSEHNKAVTIESIVYSPSIDRIVFVGYDNLKTTHYSYDIFYSDFSGGTDASHIIFKQTKSINDQVNLSEGKCRKIIWNSDSEYFIICSTNFSGKSILYSKDGINWFSDNNPTTNPSNYLENLGSLTYGDGKLVLTEYDGSGIYQTATNYITPLEEYISFGNSNVNASFKNVDILEKLNLKQITSCIDASLTNLDVSGKMNLNKIQTIDASFDNVDIDKRLLIQGYDFSFNYITVNYPKSFNYIANIPLQDPSNNNIFTENNSTNIFNTNIAYSPTLKIYVISRENNLIYSYNGIDWYICKNDSNGFMEFSYTNNGFIEWFGDDLNKFFMTTNPSNANDDRNKFMYYSENGIIWKSIFINSWNSEEAKPNKIIYSSTLQKLFAIGNDDIIWESSVNQIGFTFNKIKNNFLPINYSSGLHMIWNSILQKFFVVVKNKFGDIPIIYYNSNNDLNQNWIRAPNVYDYTNKLIDPVFNKAVTIESIVYSPSIDRIVFVGYDNLNTTHYSYDIFYSDFSGGTDASHIIFKQTKSINDEVNLSEGKCRKIIWNSDSEYFIICSTNFSGKSILYSKDGINWFSDNNPTTNPSNYLENLGSLTYGDGKLVLTEYDGSGIYQTATNYITPFEEYISFGNSNVNASFKNITANTLLAVDASFTNLDVSGNTKLQTLLAVDASFTNLDVSGNTKLQTLLAVDASFTNLDVSGNTKLQTLLAVDASFTNLDVSGNTKLQTLLAVDASFTNLDVSGNTKLQTLLAVDASFTNLDVSGNTKLQTLLAVDASFTNLDVSGNTKLQTLLAVDASFTNLDVSGNTKLQTLLAVDASFTNLDVSGNTKLQTLLAVDASFTNLDVSGNTKLQTLLAVDASFTNLDVSGNTKLQTLLAVDASFTNLDVSGNTKLQTLLAVDASFTNLDVSGNTKLQTLLAVDASFTNLDVSGNTKLQTLLAVDASFTNLDVSGNTKLQTLLAVDASFTNLDVSGNTKLQTLLAVDASFTNLDVSGNTKLQTLLAVDASFTNLDVSGNTTLQTLLAVDASFTNLDVSGNTKLQTLLAVDASFTNLDVSGNTTLQTLLAVDASFTNLDVSQSFILYDASLVFTTTNISNITIKAPLTTPSGDYSLTLPQTRGISGDFLSIDASGQLIFKTVELNSSGTRNDNFFFFFLSKPYPPVYLDGCYNYLIPNYNFMNKDVYDFSYGNDTSLNRLQIPTSQNLQLYFKIPPRRFINWNYNLKEECNQNYIPDYNNLVIEYRSSDIDSISFSDWNNLFLFQLPDPSINNIYEPHLYKNDLSMNFILDISKNNTSYSEDTSSITIEDFSFNILYKYGTLSSIIQISKAYQFRIYITNNSPYDISRCPGIMPDYSYNQYNQYIYELSWNYLYFPSSSEEYYFTPSRGRPKDPTDLYFYNSPDQTNNFFELSISGGINDIYVDKDNIVPFPIQNSDNNINYTIILRGTSIATITNINSNWWNSGKIEQPKKAIKCNGNLGNDIMLSRQINLELYTAFYGSTVFNKNGKIIAYSDYKNYFNLDPRHPRNRGKIWIFTYHEDTNIFNEVTNNFKPKPESYENDEKFANSLPSPAIKGDQEDDMLGSSISLNDDGNIIATNIIGNGKNTVKLYTYNSSNKRWDQIGPVISNENFGIYFSNTENLYSGNIELNDIGNIVAIGSSNTDVASNQKCIVLKLEDNNDLLAWNYYGQSIDVNFFYDHVDANLKFAYHISLSKNFEKLAISEGLGSNNYYNDNKIRIFNFNTTDMSWDLIQTINYQTDASYSAISKFNYDGTYLAVTYDTNSYSNAGFIIYKYTDGSYVEDFSVNNIEGYNITSVAGLSFSGLGNTIIFSDNYSDSNQTNDNWLGFTGVWHKELDRWYNKNINNKNNSYHPNQHAVDFSGTLLSFLETYKYPRWPPYYWTNINLYDLYITNVININNKSVNDFSLIIQNIEYSLLPEYYYSCIEYSTYFNDSPSIITYASGGFLSNNLLNISLYDYLKKTFNNEIDSNDSVIARAIKAPKRIQLSTEYNNLLRFDNIPFIFDDNLTNYNSDICYISSCYFRATNIESSCNFFYQNTSNLIIDFSSNDIKLINSLDVDYNIQFGWTPEGLGEGSEFGKPYKIGKEVSGKETSTFYIGTLKKFDYDDSDIFTLVTGNLKKTIGTFDLSNQDIIDPSLSLKIQVFDICYNGSIYNNNIYSRNNGFYTGVKITDISYLIDLNQYFDTNTDLSKNIFLKPYIQQGNKQDFYWCNNGKGTITNTSFTNADGLVKFNSNIYTFAYGKDYGQQTYEYPIYPITYDLSQEFIVETSNIGINVDISTVNLGTYFGITSIRPTSAYTVEASFNANISGLSKYIRPTNIESIGEVILEISAISISGESLDTPSNRIDFEKNRKSNYQWPPYPDISMNLNFDLSINPYENFITNISGNIEADISFQASYDLTLYNNLFTDHHISFLNVKSNIVELSANYFWDTTRIPTLQYSPSMIRFNNNPLANDSTTVFDYEDFYDSSLIYYNQILFQNNTLYGANYSTIYRDYRSYKENSNINYDPFDNSGDILPNNYSTFTQWFFNTQEITIPSSNIYKWMCFKYTNLPQLTSGNIKLNLVNTTITDLSNLKYLFFIKVKYINSNYSIWYNCQRRETTSDGGSARGIYTNQVAGIYPLRLIIPDSNEIQELYLLIGIKNNINLEIDSNFINLEFNADF